MKVHGSCELRILPDIRVDRPSNFFLVTTVLERRVHSTTNASTSFAGPRTLYGILLGATLVRTPLHGLHIYAEVAFYQRVSLSRTETFGRLMPLSSSSAPTGTWYTRAGMVLVSINHPSTVQVQLINHEPPRSPMPLDRVRRFPCLQFEERL